LGQNEVLLRGDVHTLYKSARRLTYYVSVLSELRFT